MVANRDLVCHESRHATDSQSWPLFIPAFPELSQRGAYSSAKIYSSSDITFIQKYAASLGITILLEVTIDRSDSLVNALLNLPPSRSTCPATPRASARATPSSSLAEAEMTNGNVLRSSHPLVS